MYEARFTTKQVYDNYAKSVSKPKNANQQAARTMSSVGIGSIGGRTTRRDRNKGSTYDEVPQVLTQGIVKRPASKPVKEKGYEKVIRVFNNAMERFGIFDEPTSTYDTVKPQNVYKSSFFSVPKVTTTTLPDMVPATPSPYRPLPSGPDTRNFGINIGADSSPEKPDSAKLDIFDILNTKEKVMRGSVPGLMSPPTMDQTKPETPGFTMEDAVNRAILATTKEYVIKPGDNLTKIAKRYNTTVKDLVQINKIENKNKIYAGESLRVPKDSVKDIKEAVLRISTRGNEDPEKQFYQSGVPIDQRIFEPEDATGFAGMGPDPSKGQGIMTPRSFVSTIENSLSDDDLGIPDTDNYMGYLPSTPAQKILDKISVGEGATPEALQRQESLGIGTTPYDMVLAYGSLAAPDKPITQMTLQEVFDFQKELIKASKGKLRGTTLGSSAVGKYQVIKSQLFGPKGTPAKPQKNYWADKLNLTPDMIFTPALQEKIGRLILKEAGYDNYLKGKKSQKNLLKGIASKWASVEGNDYGQPIKTSQAELAPILDTVQPDYYNLGTQ